MIVSLDFERAFDSVEKDTILAVLEKFNFGNSFMNMVKVLICNSESSVQNGGWISGFFKTERGIKQGCCASPLFFILVAEIMAIKIKNNNNIKGLQMATQQNNNRPIKILQYADDTSLTLDNTDDLTHALSDLNTFSLLSGLKLNTSKSIGMWIGSSKNNQEKPGGISWIKNGEELKILGIYFSAEQEASNIEKNWSTRLENIERYIKTLQKQNCSLYGKVILCKTFLLSQISFLLQSLSLPEHVINKIDTLFFKFIWQKKHSNKKAREKIKRSVMCRTIEEGGLQMIKVRDQQRAFLLKWFYKTLGTKESISLYKTTNLYEVFFSKLGGAKYIVSSTSLHENNKNLLSKFWTDVINLWVETNKNIKDNSNSISNIFAEPIFNNHQICYKGKPLFYKNWIDNGLMYIKDICSQRGILSFNELKEKNISHPGLILEHNALVNAIPKQWMETITTSPVPADIDTDYMDKLKILNTNNAKLRELTTQSTENEICGKNFWKHKTGVDIYPFYKMAQSATKESKLRLLHFKILHNIYPSNILLNRMGIKETELCEICGVTDFIEHMFIHCTQLKGFWKKVFQLIQNYTNEKFPISDNNILFGFNYENLKATKRKINTANHILLVAKMSVSKMRYGSIKNIDLIFEAEMSIRKKYFDMV